MNSELIREELFKLGVREYENLKISEIRNKDGIYLYRVNDGNNNYVLKYFMNENHSVEIKNYKILHELELDTIKVYNTNNNSILMEDLNHSKALRLATKEDICKEEVGYALAEWYLNFHNRGIKYINGNKEATHLKREIDSINEKSIVNIRAKDEKNKLWDLILNNIEEVKKKIISMEETLNYNDFYWTNFAVHRNIGKIRRAVVFDYNMMGLGLRYNDIRNVTVSLEGKAREAFLEAYGEFNELEKIIDKPMCELFNLIEAYKREVFPKWALESKEKVESGELERDFRELIEALGIK